MWWQLQSSCHFSFVRGSATIQKYGGRAEIPPAARHPYLKGEKRIRRQKSPESCVRMRKSYVLCISLILSLILVLPAGAAPAQASDYLDSFAREEIETALEEGLLQERDGRIGPEELLTRGEFVQLVNRFFGLSKLSENNFSDVPDDHPYAREFLLAKEAGYIGGFSDGTVQPDKGVSRQEAAVLAAKMLHLENPDTEYPSLTNLADYEEIAQWARPLLALCIREGYINLYPDNTLRPLAEISREEAVYLLVSLTGTRLREGSLGGGKETLELQGNLTLLNPDVVLENVRILGDLVVTEAASGGTLTIRDSDLSGTLTVRGAGNFLIIMENSRLQMVKTRNPYGLTTLRRDSLSTVRNYLEDSPLKLDVTLEGPEAQGVEKALSSPLMVLLVLVFVAGGLLLTQRQASRKPLFVGRGQTRRIRLTELTPLPVTGVRETGEGVVSAWLEEPYLVLRGLESGRDSLELLTGTQEQPGKTVRVQVVVV